MTIGGNIGRIAKFVVVGLSGVAVNLAVSELLFRVVLTTPDDTARLALANALGVVVSIFTNFLLNDRWTWGDRNKGARSDWFRRLTKYYISASVAGVVQVSVSALAFEYVFTPHAVELAGFDLSSTLAICAGIGMGMMINLLASHFWAFKDVEQR